MNPFLLFPAVLLGIMLVVYGGFRTTFFKWLWTSKWPLAGAVALTATIVELVGMATVMAFMPMAVQLVFQLVFAMVFMVVQFGAMMWIMSRPRVTWYMPGEFGDQRLTFEKDYVGNPVVRKLLQEVVDNINSNTRFRQLKGKPSRGVLMSGPPGTGKSYGARIVASECGVPFCLVDSASLQSAFMGMGSMTVMSLYRKARKYSKQYGACIIFLDEIDAIGGARSAQGGGMGMMGGMMMGGGSQLLNTLLTCLDPGDTAAGGFFAKFKRKLGFTVDTEKMPYVLTMAATNVPEKLDAALVRDGRMDLNIIVDLPDSNGRYELFDLYLKKIVTDPEIDPKVIAFDASSAAADTVRRNIRRLAHQTGGWSPASIMTIVTNKAVAEAARRSADAVSYEDVTAARRTKSFGVKQPLLSMTDQEKRRIAYHEAGHAVVGMGFFGDDKKVEYGTIIRRDNALGLIAWAFVNERHTVTKSELLAQIDVSLGSRAVEIELLGDEMSGFSGDLAHATSNAANMISVYGMDQFLVSSHVLGGQSVPMAAINRILQERMAMVRALVREHKDLFVAVAELLLEKEEVDGDELYELFYTFVPERKLVYTEAILGVAKTLEDEYKQLTKRNSELTIGQDAVLSENMEKSNKLAPAHLPNGSVATASALGLSTPLCCCRAHSENRSTGLQFNPDSDSENSNVLGFLAA
jgi:cell division protease FtsH